MSVIVKEVDGRRIYVGETVEIEESVHRKMLAIFAIVMYCFLGPTLLVVLPIEQSLGFTLVWIIGIAICLFHHSKTEISQYQVFAVGLDSIYIVKTNPEEDQKAICKAVQKIERTIKDLAERDANLQEIAKRCK